MITYNKYVNQHSLSGTELTWSLQFRNLAEWDWVPIFLENKYGGECRHQRTMSFCSVLSFPALRDIKQRFSWTVLMEFLDIRQGVMCLQFMGDFTYRDSASRQVQLFISFVNFRATSLVSISYIFPPTVVLRTLFLILNICYELTILVWVLQQSYGNVH